jgi:hypothetical protein
VVALNARNLDRETRETTLGVLLKHEGDLQRVRAEIQRGSGERSRFEDEDLGRSRRLN